MDYDSFSLNVVYNDCIVICIMIYDILLYQPNLTLYN